MLMRMTKKPLAGLLIGALGVVFGDIGTSPLYVMKVLFGSGNQHLPVNQLTVFGIISLILWTVTIVVSIKYIGFIMRADNNGEGGIMALVARAKSGWHDGRLKTTLLLLGIIGVALFYGDSAITPAISVLSAVEGLKIIQPHLASYVVPVTVVVLIGLFWIQKYGTAFIGKLFGPVMLLWFLVLAAGGAWRVSQYPMVLHALSPGSAAHFIAMMPGTAFIAMSAVVLAITGAEALFADMGHFGRGPIARSWFFVVFPALALCYMGQGALILRDAKAASDPFYFLFPHAVHIPMLLLAAIATLIASQSVISGAFSLTRQAVQIGFLPRMTIHHTSDSETGQIYVPFVNFALFLAVMLFVLTFGSSVHLAGAYGIAVSGAIAVDTILFFAVMLRLRTRWKYSMLVPALLFFPVDIVLVAANLPKILHGGWLPIAIAIAVLIVIDTWWKGEDIVRAERRHMEGSLQTFITRVHQKEFGKMVRVPGQAVYVGHHPGLAPLALHATVENLRELHQKVAIVYVKVADAAHVPEHERAEIDGLKYADGISQVTLTFGYHDTPNIPRTLEAIRGKTPELNFDPYAASYFVSLTNVVLTKRRNMAGWRKALFSVMDRNSEGSGNYYKLPFEQTTEMRALIKL